jgi:hypothetical protein
MTVGGECRCHKHRHISRGRGRSAGKFVRNMLKQYITFPASETDQPPRHLRGYTKPYLLPNQTKTVEFELVGRTKDSLMVA